MNPRFFFKGNLAREISASAFLATLLDSFPRFRQHFYKTAGLREPEGAPTVETEEDQVDIKLHYTVANAVVLVENKILAGAVQRDQLVRYYSHERQKSPASQVYVVFVVPREGVGGAEFGRLTETDGFKPEDAGMVSWGDLAEYALPSDLKEGDAEFVRSGLECVLEIIKSGRETRYPPIGGREVPNDIAQAVKDRLASEFPDVCLAVYTERDYIQIWTQRTYMTVWIDIAFRAGNEPPFAPLDIPDRQHVTATLRTRFKLSGKGEKDSKLSQMWRHWCEENGWLGHVLEGRWFKLENKVVADAATVERQLTDMGRHVLSGLAEYL